MRLVGQERHLAKASGSAAPPGGSRWRWQSGGRGCARLLPPAHRGRGSGRGHGSTSTPRARKRSSLSCGARVAMVCRTWRITAAASTAGAAAMPRRAARRAAAAARAAASSALEGTQPLFRQSRPCDASPPVPPPRRAALPRQRGRGQPAPAPMTHRSACSTPPRRYGRREGQSGSGRPCASVSTLGGEARRSTRPAASAASWVTSSTGRARAAAWRSTKARKRWRSPASRRRRARPAAAPAVRPAERASAPPAPAARRTAWPDRVRRSRPVRPPPGRRRRAPAAPPAAGRGRPKARLPPTDRCGNSRSSWNRMPIRRRSGGKGSRMAPVQHHPARGRCRPAGRLPQR